MVSLVFSKNHTHPSPAKVGFSKFPTYFSRKRTFDTAIPKRPSVLRFVCNPKVSVPQIRKPPPDPPADTVTSERDQKFRDYWDKVRRNIFVDNPYSTMPVSSTPPIQSPVSNPPYQEVSDEFYSQSDDLLDKVMSNRSLTVTRVSTGSPIETYQSQSPSLLEAPTQVPLHLRTAPVLAMPPIKKLNWVYNFD